MPDDMTRLCERIATLEEATRTLSKRVDGQDEIVKAVYEIANTTNALVKSLEQTNENIRLMRRDVDDLRLKPGKRWDVIVTSAITAAVGGTVGAAIAFFFGKKGG